MKSLNKIILFFLPILGNSVECNSEITFASEGPKCFDSSEIKFSGTFFDYFDDDKRAWLVSPQVYYSPTGQPSFSVCTGIRHDVGDVVLGNHLFLNICNVGSTPIYQFGKSFDVLHDKWEARVNYYFPSKIKTSELSAFYETAHQLEGEFTYKTPYCTVGASNLYHLKEKTNALTFKVILPFEKLSVGTNITLQTGEPIKCGISIGYNFWSSQISGKKSKNAVYNHLPRYSRTEIPRYVAPAPAPVIVAPVKEREPEVVVVPPPVETHWWDWFFPSKDSTSKVNYDSKVHDNGWNKVDGHSNHDTPIVVLSAQEGAYNGPRIETPSNISVVSRESGEITHTPTPTSCESEIGWDVLDNAYISE